MIRIIRKAARRITKTKSIPSDSSRGFVDEILISIGGWILPFFIAGCVFSFVHNAASAQGSAMTHNLTPVPASLRFNPGRLAITSHFTIAVKGHSDARLLAAIDRMARRMEARAGLTFAREPASDADAATLVIQVQSAGKAIPAVDEDESYTLEVSNSQASLDAPTVTGALRGLETFLQLLSGDRDGYFIPAVSVHDRPRFPWRGLLIDVVRHWQPMEVIKRNLDGMAMVKLNVLHLHLTDDQGFRIESRKYPKLHLFGSDGNYYTQAEMREIIEYARMRGIRVVPEFDMPGHTASWFVGYPELASKPGPYQIERKWVVTEPVMDPTSERLYKFLDGFLGEMAAIFPDAYMHIGGDEVEGTAWKENPKIQAFIQKEGLKDNQGLQAYFNRRLSRILAKHRKKMIGWDEILHPDLPKDIVIQSWRGPESLAEAAKKGYQGILSHGYYLDLNEPASRHYLNDPIPEGATLTPEEQKLILGGEAAMWTEWVSPETIDSRIWPRAAAIAERLWSSREIRDVDDMYRRLALVSARLEDAGLLHKRNPPAMARRLAGNLGGNQYAVEAVKRLLDAVEPVKGHGRGETTQFTPLTRLADAATPDSAAAREFSRAAAGLLYAGSHDRGDRAAAMLASWREAGRGLPAIIEQSPILAEALPLAKDLEEISEIGLEAIKYLNQGKTPPGEWRSFRLARLEAAAIPKAAVELAIVQPVKELVIAAAEQEKRKTMSAEEWEKRIKSLAEKKPQ